jgi:leucyl-tRNA synthetase
MFLCVRTYCFIIFRLTSSSSLPSSPPPCFFVLQVCDAKAIVRKTLIDRGDAFAYFEPESTVVGRSGDECIVALTDQWYLSYGDAQWQQQLTEHIHDAAHFNSYNGPLLEAFDKAVGWLSEWACSRQFGLGTQLPWDQKWVIDSLSDSTIYMALYTIAHHFFGGSADNLSGTNGPSPSGIQAEHMTPEVFDYIFLHKPLPAGTACPIPAAQLDTLRADFEYWYPMDLRVSAKDLIPNHLTMCLYNHAEIWKDQKHMWPKGIYCNGHIMVRVFLVASMIFYYVFVSVAFMIIFLLWYHVMLIYALIDAKQQKLGGCREDVQIQG